MPGATSFAHSRHVVVRQNDLLKPAAVAQAGGQSACQVVGPQVQYLHASKDAGPGTKFQDWRASNKLQQAQVQHEGVTEPIKPMPQGGAAWLLAIQWSWVRQLNRCA